jgi:hypothetical protein
MGYNDTSVHIYNIQQSDQDSNQDTRGMGEK